MNRTSSFGLGHLGITYRASLVSDITYPPYTFEINVATAIPLPLTPYFNLLRPFSGKVWACVIFSIILTMLTLYLQLRLISWYGPFLWEKDVWTSFECSFGSICGQGTDLQN